MVKNLYNNELKSGFSAWMTFCFLTVILLLNISEIAYTQNIEESQLEAIRQQLRQSGMTESEIESKINLLKVSGGVPRIARRLGHNARERAAELYLVVRSLVQYAGLIESLDD